MSMSSRGRSSDSKEVEVNKLCAKLTTSAERVVTFLETKLQQNGSYGDEVKDIACYFKSPLMFIVAGKPASAAAVLNHIKKSFMSPTGDFNTSGALKSTNPAYIEYWSYTNGWIVRAAHALGRTDISESGQAYLKLYDLGTGAGFLTNNLETKPSMTDVLTTAHHGLIQLEMGKKDVAIRAGQYLCDAILKQPNLKKGFYLRFDKAGNVITQFSKDHTPFYFVSSTEPNQLHFMVGYPCAYLVMLFKRTNNSAFLNAAKAYMDFSLTCDQSVYACDFSHKIAWAASLLYEVTGDKKYLTVIDKISDYFISKQQKNGMWFIEDANASYDQSAEIACWFLDIVKNINNCKKKLVPEDAKKTDPHSKEQKSSYSNYLKYGAGLLVGLGFYALYRSLSSNTDIPPQPTRGAPTKLKGI